MNELNLITQDGQVLVGSRSVAEHFGKEHSKVIRAIENKISTNPKLASLGILTSSYLDNKGEERKEYLLTRDGFSFIVMGFTGAKADEWKMKYIEAFNKMEEAIKNPYQNLSTEMKALLMHDEKLQIMDSRVVKLENNMTIDYGQKKTLRDLGNKRVMQVLGGKHTLAYKHFGKQAFAEIWKHYKNVMNINSYENTAVKEFERGKEILLNWTPSKQLAFAITGANTQTMEVGVN